MVALVKPLPDAQETPDRRHAIAPAERTTPFMRLAGADDPPQSGRIGADRRIFARRDLSLRVAGRRLDHSVEARREPFLNFQMKDVSLGGLAATSQTRLSVGERVAVFFPPEGSSRGWDAYGRVLRVEPRKQGWGVAVSFDPLHAA